MKIKLIRYGSTPMGTFGELHVGSDVLFTVERPWLNNERGVSCVPRGTYKLEPHDSQKHPDSFALVNHDLGVYHYEDPKAARFGILIHPANMANELEGCIALGFSLGCIGGTWAVINSRNAMKIIRAYGPTELEIVQKE